MLVSRPSHGAVPLLARALCSRPKQILALLQCPHGTPHDEVRRRYLAKAKQTHPDHATSDGHAFVELQAAWEAYERARPRRTGRADRAGGTFTKFGVGCSWTDDGVEREERREVVDAASRGETVRQRLREGRAPRPGQDMGRGDG